MDVIDIPPYFLCPISLQIMRDPVTLCTGITYDRESIERWITRGKNNTCPVTKQALWDSNLTPNHTLRRLTQAWCTVNASNGVERFPTPRSPVDKEQITKLLEDARMPQSQMNSLRRLRSIVMESERNRQCAEAAGAQDVLVSIIKDDRPSVEEGTGNTVKSTSTAGDEALQILSSLQISEQGLRDLISRNDDLIESLTVVLGRSNDQSRAYATSLLRSIFESVAPVRLAILQEDLFVKVVKVLRDRISYKTSKEALRILVELSPWGGNRIKAVSAGGVTVMIELLLEEGEKRLCAMMLVVLDQLCGCVEGRAQLIQHGAGIAVVSKKVLRVSQIATEEAVRILYLVSKYAATPSVLQEMLQLGVVSKLLLVLNMDCGVKTKAKAKEILRLHSKIWQNSPCIAPRLQASYPTS